MNEADKFSSGKAVKMLVGNKCDLQAERSVSREEAQNYAESEGMTYF